MPRIFVAVGEDLAGVQEKYEQIKNDFADFEIKWVDPKNIHATLTFLGEISDEQVEQVKEAVREEAQNFSPSELEVAGLGIFPERPENAHVLWVGFDHDDRGKRIAAIAFALQQNLILKGFEQHDHLIPSEKKSTTGQWEDFEAHVTLGRFKSKIQDPVKLQKMLDKYKDEHFGKMKLDAILIMQSELKPEGPEYTVVERVLLEGLETE